MAHWYKFVLYYLWIAPHALLVVVPVLMFVRRLHKNFPVFFVYTLYETLGFLLRFAAYTVGHGLGGGLYRYVFIVTAAGSTALRFGIIQEIFNNVFHDYPRLEETCYRFHALGHWSFARRRHFDGFVFLRSCFR